MTDAEHLRRTIEFEAGRYRRLAESAERRADEPGRSAEARKSLLAYARYYRNAALAIRNLGEE